MKSKPFEITVTGNSYSLHLPEKIVEPFLKKNMKRVKAIASFEKKDIVFYAAIQKRNRQYYMIFGKRHQKKLGLYPNDYFQLQLFEDTSKYGVEMPEELDAVLLSDHDAITIFQSFTAGKKRSLIYTIARYTTSQARIDKSILLCENLKRGIRDKQMLLKSF